MPDLPQIAGTTPDAASLGDSPDAPDMGEPPVARIGPVAGLPKDAFADDERPAQPGLRRPVSLRRRLPQGSRR